MILRPLDYEAQRQAAPVAAWDAVASTQKRTASAYLLIRQPDHARLAGELAQALRLPSELTLDDEIVEGISLHDEGWAYFDDSPANYQATEVQVSGEYALKPDGKPVSFLDVRAPDAIRAWTASIDAAEDRAPTAALIVSEHFVRISRFGVSAGHYGEEDCASVRTFLDAEQARQRRLQPQQKRSKEELQYWTDVLQFCDLLSLYLCCGSTEPIQFPQQFFGAGQPIVAVRDDDRYRVRPSMLNEQAFSCSAFGYPSSCANPQRLTCQLV